ncbi:polynucleotide adenylyltransferase, partial [Coprococcus eutactus]|nr:polynucleotide adenylyltransferase [Coprococcus eutactus]
KRRDFTINAMAYSHSKVIIDMFGVVQDLNDKVIRAVGVARDRFDEDGL